MPKYSTKMDQQYIDLLNLTPKVSEKDQRYNTPWDRAPSVWERAERIINAVFELKSEGTAAILRELRDRLEADMDRIRVEKCACEDTADTLLEEQGRIEADMDRIREKEDACDDTAATLREERDLVETDIPRVVGSSNEGAFIAPVVGGGWWVSTSVRHLGCHHTHHPPPEQ